MASFRTFFPDRKGSVAVIVALLLPVLLVAMGVAIDIARAYRVKSELQGIVDAASVAAAAQPLSASNLTAAQVVSQLTPVAQRYIDANKPAATTATLDPITLTYDAASKMVTLSLKAKMPTLFMSAVKKDVDFTLGTSVRRAEQGPLDLALVLDTTKSMRDLPQGGTEAKITSLIAAATSLADQVITAGKGQVRVALVPYADYIMVGKTNPAPQWIKVPADLTTSSCLEWTYQYPDAKCIPASTYDCLVDGFWKVNGCTKPEDCSPKGTKTCKTSSTTTYTWGGCLGARTVGTDGVGTDTYLYNISTPTAPPWPGILGTPCQGVILPLTNDKTTVLNRIKGLSTWGETHLPTGLTWGWNVLTPQEPYVGRTQAELAPVGGRKAIIFMTDGKNSVAPRLRDGAFQPFGSTQLTPEWRDGTKTDQLTASLCESIKNPATNNIGMPVDIYTVRFDVNDSAINKLLTDCATDPSMSYSASNRDDLLRAFNDISEKLKRLAIVN